MRHSIGCSISEVEAFGLANMDFSSSRQWIEALWLLFGAYWLASALKRKKTKQRETLPQRFGYVLPLALGFYLLSQPQVRDGWLGSRFVSAGPAGEWIGVLLTARESSWRFGRAGIWAPIGAAQSRSKKGTN